MNGIKPKFLDNVTLSPEYFAAPNPYKTAPSCNVNLLALSRYAASKGKKLVELTQDEVQRFAI